jgi:arylsulfatase A-like enzyme
VPCVVRWPGQIPAGTVLNGIVSHNDWFVTLLAAAGNPDISEQLKVGTDLNGTTYKVHLDGHNQLDYVTAAADESPRKFFFYVSDDGDLTSVRYDNFKLVFMEQRCEGTLRIWAEPFTALRVPLIFNLRTYYDWILDHAWVCVPAQAFVFQMMQTLIEFPVRQKPASFSLQQVLEKLQTGMPSA